MIINWNTHSHQYFNLAWPIWYGKPIPAGPGRIMSSIAGSGGLISAGGIAGTGGGLAG